MAKRNNPQPGEGAVPTPADSPTPVVRTPEGAAGVDSPLALLSAMAVSTRFAGPLPPPEVLKQYNEAVPDAAERILRMAEQQAAHRQKLEAKVVDSDIWKSYAGVIGAFVIVMAGFVTAYFIAPHLGWQGVAGAVGLPIAGVVWTFIHGTNSRRQERANRTAALTPPK